MTHPSFESESDRAERAHARGARVGEIMAGSGESECRHPNAKFCVCEHCMRETAKSHCDADRACGRGWSCMCASCRITRHDPPTPAESRALARAADEDVAADDFHRSRL